ncbi:uncharacterized protein ARMOST_05420 [Armillaria ostoyae]|uniref:Uncharacterized protein n=1 Tax=Armillaria ostoyae TaxID=47428 RepID=A0A284R032_ARMOS|nr:uncharacterized protein ARMOST_05420 [Armillaria ostoyae]
MSNDSDADYVNSDCSIPIPAKRSEVARNTLVEIIGIFAPALVEYVEDFLDDYLPVRYGTQEEDERVMPIIISDDEDEVQVVTKPVERPQIERDDEVYPRKRTRLAPDDSSRRASASSSRITRASHTKTVAPSATLTTPDTDPDPTINADSATQDPPNNHAPTTEEITSTKPKTQKSKTRAKKTTEPPSDTALDPARVDSASGVISDLVAQFLAKEKGLHGLKDSYVASLDQLLEKQMSCWGAQKAVVEAQKDAFIAQKEAAEAQKEAADASKAAEEVRLKTLTYAKENKIPLQPATSAPKPVDHRPVMQPMQPPQPMVQYGFPHNVPMQYQYSVAPDTNQYAYQQAPNMSVSAPPPA